MNVRDFCREPDFRSAVLLTWSIDAPFFERLVLPDLHAGGTGAIAVLADQRQVGIAMARWPGSTQHLGRRYLLDTPMVSGHYHPKVMLRIGPKGASIWVGTGNVTPGGWGGNRELATAWRVGPGEEDPGGWVAAFLDQLISWAGNPLVRETIARMRDEAWIREASADASDARILLWTSVDATLAQQVARRWSGRRFTEVRLTTGSTDESGSFLDWTHRTFGVERATIVVHAASASFDSAKLEKVPMEIKFVEPEEGKPLHAKCFWFHGPGGPAALVGSANCSASAWLRPAAAGGNVEAVVVYDSPDPEEWRSVLSVFAGTPVSPRDHLREGTVHELGEPSPETPYRLAYVQLDARAGRVSAQLVPDPENDARVSLLVGDEEIRLAPRRGPQASGWEGPRPEASPGAQVMFASIKVVDRAGSFVLGPRWMDQPNDLREAARDRRVSAALGRLSMISDSKEHRRIVDDLRIAMDAILNDHAAFPDAHPTHRRDDRDSAGDVDARRLDPKQVAVEIDSAESEAISLAAGPLALPVSLSGVLRALFDSDRDEDDSELAAVDIASDEEDNGHESDSVETPGPTPPTPPDRLKKRLASQMEKFLNAMRQPSFATTCTATQLVEAAAFPIALATLGSRGGWVSRTDAQRWAVSAVIALLHEPVAKGESDGLLDHVRARYKADNREEVFAGVVGDGRLWTVTATVLAGFRWDGLGGRIQRALLLRSVFERDELCAHVEAAELRAMAERFSHGDAVETVTLELPRVVSSLEDLESWLESDFEELIADQKHSIDVHEVNDPLWRPGVGWVFASAGSELRGKLTLNPWRPGQFVGRTSGPRTCAPGFYVNVRVALAARKPGLQVP